MKRTTTKKRSTAARSKKQNKPFLQKIRRLPSLALIGIGVLVLLVGGVLFNYSFGDKGNANAAMAITTFQTTYKGYNPGTSWMSLTSSQRCSKTQTIYGAKPVDPGNYPTLVYLHGATADTNKNKEGQQFIQRAAAQGFNAYAVTYSSGVTINQQNINRHAYCIFDQNHTGDALTAVCSTGADCSNGILLSGFSFGSAIGAIGKNYNDKVKALWALGLSAYIYNQYNIPSDTFAAPNGTRVLPNDKISINMGQSSKLGTKNLLPEDLPSLKKLTGVDCGTGFDCLQPNGAGYYVVSNAEIKDKVADHCYWEQVNKYTTGLSCTTAPTEFDPGFQPPATTKWSMINNLNWLKAQL